MSSRPPAGFLVLAAGHSRRFGGAKLAAPFSPSETVLGEVLRQLCQLQAPVAVVTSKCKTEVLKIARQKAAATVLMSCESTGLGESIGFGVAATNHWGGWIICLADMPWITADVYRQVWMKAQAGHQQVAPLIAGRRGHPVFFDASYKKALTALKGDSGAASVIDPSVLKTFDVIGSSMLRDVDTPEDLV